MDDAIEGRSLACEMFIAFAMGPCCEYFEKTTVFAITAHYCFNHQMSNRFYFIPLRKSHLRFLKLQKLVFAILFQVKFAMHSCRFQFETSFFLLVCQYLCVCTFSDDGSATSVCMVKCH